MNHKQQVKKSPGRFGDCTYCTIPVTPEDYDGCIGTLPPPVMNACCGHGNIEDAYVQLDHKDFHGQPDSEDSVKVINKFLLKGKEAMEYIINNKPH